MTLFDLFRKKQTYVPSEQDLRWNRFLEEVFSKDLSELNAIQKNAALCFRYDAEVQNGGHGQYFDCYDDINPQQVIAALSAAGYPEIVENFEKTLTSSILSFRIQSLTEETP